MWPWDFLLRVIHIPNPYIASGMNPIYPNISWDTLGVGGGAYERDEEGDVGGNLIGDGTGHTWPSGHHQRHRPR